MTEADLRRVLDERMKLNAGARTLVETMNKHGAHTMLVSGGFTFFTSAVAAQAGFRGEPRQRACMGERAHWRRRGADPRARRPSSPR